MIDSTDIRPLPDADTIAVAQVAPLTQRRRCAHCGGPFGLIRRRRAARQFCSSPCMESYDDALRRSAQAKARWLDFLDRARAARTR